MGSLKGFGIRSLMWMQKYGLNTIEEGCRCGIYSLDFSINFMVFLFPSCSPSSGLDYPYLNDHSDLSNGQLQLSHLHFKFKLINAHQDCKSHNNLKRSNFDPLFVLSYSDFKIKMLIINDILIIVKPQIVKF